jgi:hypothetical protein
MRKLHPLTYAALASAFAFLLTFSFNGTLVGMTIGSALLPSAPAPLAQDTVATMMPDPSDTLVADAPAPAVDSTELAASFAIDLKKLVPLPPSRVDSETLWLARVIYSETNRPEEQELVAWVVRNRVETAYRGKRTYQDVVLDPYQFSAFNPDVRTRQFFTSLAPQAKAPGWQAALSIAHHVRNGSANQRPFSLDTRHFYSERSMVGRKHPVWAEGYNPVRPDRNFRLEPQRFRFFEGIG